MSKRTTLQLACVALMAIFGFCCASAFSTSMYATSSKLATGKWVKITIPESGMYEVTYDEMREMGFSNPDNVKVYGFGGNRISELMNGSVPDDLKAIPLLRTNGKICFYGNGPISMSISDYSTTPHFTRIFNPYSQVGCYFLTEETTPDVKPAMKSVVTVSNYIDKPSSLNYFYHESELVSILSSGKEMLGEDFLNGNLRIDYYLPGLADSTIVVQTSIAAAASEITYANAVLHSDGGIDSTVYTLSSSRIYRPSLNVFYNYASPFASLKLTNPSEHGQFEPYLTYTSAEGTSTIARLDYFILTYKRYNIIPENGDGQILMGYSMTRGNERFQLPGASSSTVVWSITNTNAPQEVKTTAYNDETGQGLSFFSVGATVSQYVAFDPTKTLKKIISHESIANQNLHAMAVPDLLIITDKSLHEQAQRVADLHKAVDGIDVAVVDQDEVFNEFSSGTRDAMAYRLLCKMLYDRDKNKFKNLLLFGTGSYDNRELQGPHPGNLLTYQSDNSNYEAYSVTTDDFFGFLDDNSGSDASAAKLRIGVGRITSADIEEAKSDVDKLVEYYANPDYGVWRNNTMVISDDQDGGMYTFQGQGYKNMIDNEMGTGMHVNTVFDAQYARSNIETNVSEYGRKTAVEGKQVMSNLLKDGMYFATYVGHAGPIAFTKANHMWVTGDVVRTSYPHLPIMSTACCDVAHYDGDSRGIAELMFHKRDGGAIALFTSSRMVYATDNDMWNRFLLKGFFSYATNGYMPTLGEAYKASKLGFNVANTNKLSLFLLGDPAIKINYPLPLFNITEVNSTDVTDSTAMATISPLCRFNVKAQVVDADGNLDTSFNGDATMTLYDKETEFTTLTFTVGGVSTARQIYTPREKLAEINGRVTNGIFTGEMIVPKSPQAKNNDVLLRVYAHKDNTDRMVNGLTYQITMLPYDESLAISDNSAPVVSSMYVNDEAGFAAGTMAGSSSMLYITATDDQGINMQANSVDNSMTLVLDGGRNSYSDVTCYANVLDGGKTVNIEFPLNNLTEGLHTVTYTVYDMVGNSTTHTITFMVGQAGRVELVADALPAYLDKEVNFSLDTDLAQAPEVIVRVTDATGKLVWKTTTTSFPVAWDMKDMEGNKVPAGLYRYFGTYSDGTNYGGTAINKLIVLDPLKVAQAN
jgi:hypothetical protein